MTDNRYTPEHCEHCSQTTTYLLAIDRGTVDIVKAFSVAIRLKGINAIHPTKEMEVPPKEYDYRRSMLEGKLTSTQIGNVSRAHRHGLLAKVRGAPGNWCLTSKGAQFLRGEPIPKFAIVSKVTGHQIGYWKPELHQATVNEFKPDMEYWTGINYGIVDGRIVTEMPIPKKAKQFQTATLF